MSLSASVCGLRGRFEDEKEQSFRESVVKVANDEEKLAEKFLKPSTIFAMSDGCYLPPPNNAVILCIYQWINSFMELKPSMIVISPKPHLTYQKFNTQVLREILYIQT